MVRDLENVWIEMSDGCRIAARIWLPEGAERTPVPAILEYIPYRKGDFIRRRDETIHRWFAEHDYACVRVDIRGSGDSDGLLHDEYLRQEQDDALEVIEWIVHQPWSSGSVGMMGKSWGAYSALQVAARMPPALKAVIAVMGTDDRFAECIHYSGGALLNDNFWWGCIMQLFNARPPDPAIVGERWREMWLERLRAEVFWPETWLRHQRLDEYWMHASINSNYAAIDCPVWFWGGWADIYRDTPFRLAEHLEAPHRITMGPWAHLYPHEGIPGPAVGFLQEALRWWDHWLKGRSTGVMQEPPLQFYMMDSVPPLPDIKERAGRWVAEAEWPSPHLQVQTLVLNVGRLDEVADAEKAILVTSPQSTGLASGVWMSSGVAGEIPGDQSLDSFGSLEFDGDPLVDRAELLGCASVTLELSVDRPVANIAVRLIDVAPDDRATLVTRGFLNLAMRERRDIPSRIVPGERYRVEIGLHGTAYAFPAGHRIRIALSTSYWPIIWPSPETVTLTVFTGVSCLRIPMRSARAEDALLPPLLAPESAPASAFTTLREGVLKREAIIDQLTGEVTHRLYADGGILGPSGKVRLESTGIEIGYVYERNYIIRPDDPNSARATMSQSYETGRGNWQVRIDAGAEMASTVTTFELNAWIEAYEGDTSVCRREWKSSIPRGHL